MSDIDIIDKPNACFNLTCVDGVFILKISDNQRRFVRFKLTENQAYLLVRDGFNAIMTERAERWRHTPTTPDR